MRILCTREVQKSIKESVHALLKDQIRIHGLDYFFEVRESYIKGLNGAWFSFAGLADHTVESIKSFEGYDICWAEEARAITKRSWDILLPTIRKPGSEIWISLNPELETDETYKRFVLNPPRNALVIKTNWRDNEWWNDTMEQERLNTLERDPEGYDNIWEGQCRPAVEGAIYYKEMAKLQDEGRIRNVPEDPILKTHRIWDLGWGVMAIIMVQRAGNEVCIIDYEEYNHKRYDEIINDLEKSRDYRWGKDFLPHDRKSTNPQTGKSPDELLTTLGCKVEGVPDIGIEPGIQAARQLFPMVYIDKEKCSLLVDRLKRYRRRINKTTDTEQAPLADDNAHGSDSFRYLAIVAPELSNEDLVITDPYKDFRSYGTQ